MRTLRELLEVMAKETPTHVRIDSPYFIRGLCDLITHLFCEDVITSEEVCLLDDYLIEHLSSGGLTYQWEPGEVKPRVHWLNEQIKKLN